MLPLALAGLVRDAGNPAAAVTNTSPLHFLGIGLITAGLLMACITGFQLLMYGIDTVRGIAELPGRLLYLTTGAGLLIFLIGLWLLHAPT
jgi:uncharacterized membrane protein YiaA